MTVRVCTLVNANACLHEYLPVYVLLTYCISQKLNVLHSLELQAVFSMFCSPDMRKCQEIYARHNKMPIILHVHES